MTRTSPMILTALLAAFLSGPGRARADSVVRTPEPGSFVMRPDLAGVHPRLYFTADDIPEIRSQGLGPRHFFVDKAHEAFGGYVGQPVDVTEDWKHYLFGFWGQFAMAMLYLVEEDPACADTAVAWALHYARTSDWLADDLVPMDITSGMALTYDILYDRLTEGERAELRAALYRSIDFMQDEFYIDEYWTNDFQNNHMHNRIHGVAHAALAILGDDPALDAQPYADLAYTCFEDMTAWLSDDGSTHEGPGYFDYGHHWVVRLHALFEHVTGEDTFTESPHAHADYWFRIYMTAPGWADTFAIGDGGGGEPTNAEAFAWPIARAADAHGADVLRTLMEVAPDGFYQQVGWGLLWYDGEMEARPVAEMPLWRFWPDLEMLSVRSSWDADATALVFKCGPPGGHEMRQREDPDWVNVAHDHPDQNHFMLHAFGRMMAVDDGYPQEQKLTRSHNTVVVDGAGQTREGEPWYQPFPYEETGTMDDVFLSRSSAYAAGNASLLYEGAERYVRHLAFVEGQYVVILDDLVGAGGTSHNYEWRLHKDGDWSETGPGRFSVADGDVSLDIRFLLPETSSLTSQMLPAELTAAPCLAVSTQAPAATLLSVIVPQRAGVPVIDAATVAATGGTAVQASHDGMTDLFGVASSSETLEAGEVRADARAVLVRTDAGGPLLAMAARTTSVSVSSRTILGSDVPANMAWRRDAAAVVVEAEKAYRAGGGPAALRIGYLEAGAAYTADIDGTFVGAVADGEGVIAIDVDLDERRTITVTPGEPPEIDADADGEDASAEGADAAADGADASIDGADGEGQAAGGEKGCGCRLGGGTGGSGAAILLALLALLAVLAVARRPRSQGVAGRHPRVAPRRSPSPLEPW